MHLPTFAARCRIIYVEIRPRHIKKTRVHFNLWIYSDLVCLSDLNFVSDSVECGDLFNHGLNTKENLTLLCICVGFLSS